MVGLHVEDDATRRRANGAQFRRRFYTFPSDSALRDEVLLARQIGLNGLREHVKIETPRKLYWADKLGDRTLPWRDVEQLC